MDASERLPRALTWASRIAALGALVSLVAEFGFPLGKEATSFQTVELAAAVLFAADVLGRLMLSPDRRAHLRRRGWESALLVLLAAYVSGTLLFGTGATLPYVLRGYILVQMGLRAARAGGALARDVRRPSWVLLGSFVALIVAGAGLLLLPNCRAPGAKAWSVSDAVFTSTSAACVTGLTVRDTATALSFRGQCVVLALIQAGGLGIVTLALCVTLFQTREVPLGQMTLARDLLGAERLGGLARLLKAMLLITLGTEALGALSLWISGESLWWSVFHSVSAFCNAGFALSADSLVSRGGSFAVCATIMALILVGGIGFPVLLELLGRRRRSRLSLHAKLAIATSVLLTLLGAAGYLVCEADHGLSGRSAGRGLLDALFQSVTTRTAGFNTVDIPGLQVTTLLLILLLMAVGGSPISTAGGVKTSTFATLALTVRAILRNRDSVEAFGRTVPRPAVNAAVAVAALYGVAVVLTAGLLAAGHPEAKFIDVVFESVSALSTVGLTTGMTERLNGFGRAVICVAMFVGRVGPLAVLWAVLSRPAALRYEYPEESVIIS